MHFDEFFKQATGIQEGPYDYQKKLAESPWPDLLDVPTGMGKTAAVTLAWLWKRSWLNGKREHSSDSNTPRRLIWCLPMRVLVEQTDTNIRTWLTNLGIYGEAGSGKVSVHLLMGGADDLKTWAEHPEEDMILIGTQDMLLSRALNRGYGMSRFQWPIHYSLLHNDALWVYDEVQLMGAGLTTSAQLDAFRRTFPLAKSSSSLWVSATLNREWLNTVDLSSYLKSLSTLSLSEPDYVQAQNRLRSVKSLACAPVKLTSETNNQKGRKEYIKSLCEFVLSKHNSDSQTIVILNRVDRAQDLFRLLLQERNNTNDLLIHARFRTAERQKQVLRLYEETNIDRIFVATQAIEAGVDVSSCVLITELAPWASTVQRFGRCNRYGEHNADEASIFWIDIEKEADTLPYNSDQLTSARAKLQKLHSASPMDLPKTDEERPLTSVIRRKDFLDLFNTDPDLSGFDVDISDYIRDSGTPSLQVFWREFKDDPNQPETQGKPDRLELCPVSVGQGKELHKCGAWYWDTLDNQWTKLNRNPRPGMTLLLRAQDGSYDKQIGFDTSLKKPPVPVISTTEQKKEDAFGEDWRSYQSRPVHLADHLRHVAEHAQKLCAAVAETVNTEAVVRAGRWHDLGKIHKVFQKSMYRCKEDIGIPLAKSDCTGRMNHERKFFRHELASMLAWLSQHDGEPDADLIAYLILAHHGKVRTSLRAMPTETADETVNRFARGIWEGETLPELEFDGEKSNETTLKLALMELGLGEQGPSWTERALKLVDEYGPMQLAWLETLVRLADWRASAEEQLRDQTDE